MRHLTPAERAAREALENARFERRSMTAEERLDIVDGDWSGLKNPDQVLGNIHQRGRLDFALDEEFEDESDE